MPNIHTLAQLETDGVIQLGRGKVISRKDLQNIKGDYPVYSAATLNDGKFGEYGRYMFDEELITWSVDSGGRFFHRKKHKFSVTNVTGFLRVLDTNVVLYKYLYYCLSHAHSSINFDWVKKAHPSVLRKEYNFIPLPSLEKQQRIAAKLDSVFAEIDKAIAATEHKQAEVVNLKQAVLAGEFSGEGGFATVKFGEAVKYGRVSGKGSNLPFVGMENISSGTMQLIGDVLVPQQISSTFRFSNKHVLFGRLRPYLQKVLVPDFEGQCSTELFCLIPCGNLDRKFLAYWLLSPPVINKIDATSTGARMPRANMNAVLDFDFPAPPLVEQKRIVKKLDAIFANAAKVAEIASKQLVNYQALKSAILKQELQGETK